MIKCKMYADWVRWKESETRAAPRPAGGGDETEMDEVTSRLLVGGKGHLVPGLYILDMDILAILHAYSISPAYVWVVHSTPLQPQ